MAVLPIKLVGEQVLRTKCRPVEIYDASLVRFVEDMLETMYAAPGIGLAAPQVGVSKRVIVIDVGDGPLCVCNPKIISHEGEEVGLEGCLSIPQLFGDVKRLSKIVVRGFDEVGRPVKVEAEGLLSRCFQHEIDHLDGKLFTDTAINLHERKPSDDEEDEDEDEQDGEFSEPGEENHE
jgi:peptide deformylase